MASSADIRILERAAVAPPPSTDAKATLPLTFLDIPWLLFTPTQPLFFFRFPAISTSHFLHAILPNIKHSLSVTLQHFYPLAGKLVTPPLPLIPYLECSEDHSVFLTVAEAAVAGEHFEYLIGNHPRSSQDFHSLVPSLPLPGKDGSKQSLLSVQITVFPGIGISIGFTYRNVVADGRTFNNFLKTWASLFRKKDEKFEGSASHDRNALIDDPNGLESIFLNEWRSVRIPEKESTFRADFPTFKDTVRATFVVCPKEMENIKKRILSQSDKILGHTLTQLLLSPYVLTCACVWVSWMRSNWSKHDQDYSGNSIHYFGFIAGGITRLRYTVPSTYSGNCVGFGRAAASREELLGDGGVIYAAKAIGDAIKRLNLDVLGGAKKWISEWEEMRRSDLHVTVTGSPKVDLYGLDFGWGRPEKIEEISIDRTAAISLCESRVVCGGIEIGLSLQKARMNAFTVLFRTLNYYEIF